jgi:drug/metabolite transporter (DMT)-like permease
LISVISPITAAGAIVPVTVGLARGEVITTIQAAGIVFAILGVALVSRPTGPAKAGRLAAGVGLALVSALALGFFLTALGIASETDPLWSTFVQRCTTCALLTAVVLSTKPAFGLARIDVGVLATIVPQLCSPPSIQSFRSSLPRPFYGSASVACTGSESSLSSPAHA